MPLGQISHALAGLSTPKIILAPAIGICGKSDMFGAHFPTLMAILANALSLFKTRILAKRTPVFFQKAREAMLASETVSPRDKELLKRVSLTIHKNDDMYWPFKAGHYLSVGLSAVRCIDQIVERLRGNDPIRSILDFPCGYGRILRFLKLRFPEAHFTAAELNQDALTFCQKEFGVRTVVSNQNIDQIDLTDTFDMVWCGSLLTHVDPAVALALVRFFHERLNPGGICVVTTQWQPNLKKLRKLRQEGASSGFGITPADRDALLDQYDATGYGYAEYTNATGYGTSVIAHDHMMRIIHEAGPWKNVVYLKQSWDNHQDVYGLLKG